MAVTVTNYSAQIRERLSQLVTNGLREAGAEVASHANSNVQSQYEAGDKLRGAYKSEVNAAGDRATVGTSAEEGLWEEFGTGSHADMQKNGGIPGRTEWWVFIPYETPRVIHHVNCIHRTEEEAKAVAESLRAEGKDAHATNGNDPNYTLEKAFLAKKNEIENEFKQLLGTGFGR